MKKPILMVAIMLILSQNIFAKEGKEIEKIAVLWPTLASVVLSLDKSPDRLVAMPPQIKKSLRDGIMFDIYPGLKSVKAKGVINNKRQANTEELLKLEPDVVFEDSRRTKSINALRNAGLNVVGLTRQKLDQEKILLSEIGGVIGREKEAKEIISWIDSVYNKVSAKTAKIDNKDKPVVVYLWQKSNLVGATHHINQVLNAAGAINGVKNQKDRIGYDPEKILKINPDIIFLHFIATKKVPSDFYNNPIFADMNAVKNRQIYKVPRGGAAGWDAPSPERGFAYEWFTRVINGDDFVSGSMRESIKEKFPMLYGKSVTDKQIDEMLYVDLNRYSAGYDKIAR